MRRYRIAVIPGDGIGKEVIPAGLEVLEALAEREGGIEFAFELLRLGIGPLSRDRPDDAGGRPRADREP